MATDNGPPIEDRYFVRWRTTLWLVTLAACAVGWTWSKGTIRDRTLPANSQPEYELASMAIKPPSNEAWRLVRKSTEYSWIWFYHADTEALLAAIWEPVWKDRLPTEPAVAAEDFFREQMMKDFDLSPDITVDSTESCAGESLGGFEYQSWRIRVSGIENADKKKRVKPNMESHRWLVFARATLPKPDLFVFFLIVPQKSEKQQAGCEAALRAVIASTRFKEYEASDVALARASMAASRFFVQAEKEEKLRDMDQLRLMKERAVLESEEAARLLPKAPQPWVWLGQLAEYNAEGLRFGEGMDRQRAEDCYRRSLLLRPTQSEAREKLARLYDLSNRAADAEREWKAAIEADPSNSEFHYQLGRFYRKHGRESDALASFREALRFWRGAELTRRELEKETRDLERKLKGK